MHAAYPTLSIGAEDLARRGRHSRPMAALATLASCLVALVLLYACAHRKAGPELIHESGPVREHTHSPAASIVEFYRGPLGHLTAVRAGECPMHPSCSEYSRQSFERHGFLIGWVMTMDRLMRCGRDEIRFAPRVYVHGRWKFYDPVKQ